MCLDRIRLTLFAMCLGMPCMRHVLTGGNQGNIRLGTHRVAGKLHNSERLAVESQKQVRCQNESKPAEPHDLRIGILRRRL